MNFFTNNKKVVLLNSEKTRLQNSLNKAEKEYDKAVAEIQKLEGDIELLKENMLYWKGQKKQLKAQLND